ncbi:MAG: penicillin-binding protein activator [Gammaproteobacteria bacterium]
MNWRPEVEYVQRFLRLAVITLAVAVAGCAGPQLRDLPDQVPDTDLDNAARAQKAYGSGRYKQAAQRFSVLAVTAESPDARLDYQLRAAEAFARVGAARQASAQLQAIGQQQLTADQSAMITVTRARLAAEAGQSQQALRLLSFAQTGLKLVTRARVGEARADVYREQGLLERGAIERIRVDSMIQDPRERAYNQQRIWNTLLELPARQISEPPPQLDPAAVGWWSLVATARKYAGSAPATRVSAYRAWKTKYPQHPANRLVVPQLLKRLADQQPTRRFQPGAARQVALLVPLSGALEAVGRSVHDGFVSAARATGNVQFRIYDTQGQSHRAVEMYRQAVYDGAELVVGPLTKEEVQSLATLPDLETPVLTLNTLGDGNWVPQKMFQFGLVPESEAEQVARQAMFNGHARAALLHAETGLGVRLAQAFTKTYEELGGEVVTVRSYPPRSDDLTSMVRQFLATDSARPLWKDIRDEPDRTQLDQQVDMAFITGNPRDARLIRPLLLFHHAVDLPVYSTSQVYTEPDPRMDQDLDGLVFCDMPAVLGRGQLSDVSTSGNALRLRSLGADALLLSRHLGQLVAQPDSVVNGHTGRLQVASDGRVTRGLDCATFTKGEPALIADEPVFSLSQGGATVQDF